MNKPDKKPLRLRAESIRKLSDRALSSAAGAATLADCIPPASSACTPTDVCPTAIDPCGRISIVCKSGVCYG
jgi:hypothetical protein